MRNLKKSARFLFATLLSFIPTLALAEPVTTLGSVFDNVASYSGDITGFFQSLSLLTSIAFLMTAYIKFRKHRKSPTKPLNPSIILFLLGIAFFVIYLIPSQASMAAHNISLGGI